MTHIRTGLRWGLLAALLIGGVVVAAWLALGAPGGAADATDALDLGQGYVFPDGTLLTQTAAGTVNVTLESGLRLSFSADDTLLLIGPGKTSVKQRSAMTPGEFSSGVRLDPAADGAVRLSLPDGHAIFIGPTNDTAIVRDAGEPGPLAAPRRQEALNCTFTVTVAGANMRGGPSQRFGVLRSALNGEAMRVIGQGVDFDGFIWWQNSNDEWVRSDLGSDDCPTVCGNAVCEEGETTESCSEDCTAFTNNAALASAGLLVSTGVGCVVQDCDSCYETIECYPDCNVCDCFKNEFGCVECFCDFGEETDDTTTEDGAAAEGTGDDTAATGTGCVFESCEACIAAFPCTNGPCTQTSCELNEFGCPTCTTAP